MLDTELRGTSAFFKIFLGDTSLQKEEPLLSTPPHFPSVFSQAEDGWS